MIGLAPVLALRRHVFHAKLGLAFEAFGEAGETIGQHGVPHRGRHAAIKIRAPQQFVPGRLRLADSISSLCHPVTLAQPDDDVMRNVIISGPLCAFSVGDVRLLAPAGIGIQQKVSGLPLVAETRPDHSQKLRTDVGRAAAAQFVPPGQDADHLFDQPHDSLLSDPLGRKSSSEPSSSQRVAALRLTA
jgi:hypothetical protein